MDDLYFVEIGNIQKRKNCYYRFKRYRCVKKIIYNDKCYGIDFLNNNIIYPFYQNGDVKINEDTIVSALSFNIFFENDFFYINDSDTAIKKIQEIIFLLTNMHHMETEQSNKDINLKRVNNFYNLLTLVRIDPYNKHIIFKTFQEGLKWLLTEENAILNALYSAIEEDDFVKALELDQNLDILSRNFHKSVDELNNKLSEKEFGKYI